MATGDRGKFISAAICIPRRCCWPRPAARPPSMVSWLRTPIWAAKVVVGAVQRLRMRFCWRRIRPRQLRRPPRRPGLSREGRVRRGCRARWWRHSRLRRGRRCWAATGRGAIRRINRWWRTGPCWPPLRCQRSRPAVQPLLHKNRFKFL